MILLLFDLWLQINFVSFKLKLYTLLLILFLSLQEKRSKFILYDNFVLFNFDLNLSFRTFAI